MAIGRFLNGWSIRSLLLVQLLVVLLPLAALGALLQIQYAKTERILIENRRLDVAANIIHVVDREVASIVAALQALAASSALHRNNLEDFRPHADAAAWLNGLNAIDITERSGQKLFSSAVQAGFPIPPRPDMSALLPAFEGHIVVSGYSIGLIAPEPIFFVTVPVKVSDGIPYVLSAGFRLSRLAGVFAEASLPAQWIAGVLDRNGVILSRSQRSDQFAGKPARPEVVRLASSGAHSGLFENTTLEGIPVANSFQRSPLTGWIAVVAVPTSIIDAPLRRSLAVFSVTIFATLILSLCLALFFARRISEPVRSLSGAAQALTKGVRPIPHPYHIEELADVWSAFDAAHTLAQERLQIQSELDEKVARELRHNKELGTIVAQLHESEARYRSAMAVGRMGSWITNLESKTRHWTDEGMSLFGLNLPGGRGHVGGPDDEFLNALHPEDKNVMAEFHRLINLQDEIDAEYRIVRNGEVVWLAGRGRAASRSADGTAVELINIVTDITARKVAEEKVKFLMNEVSHRSKNLLTVIQAIASQTARSSTSIADFRQSFGQRLSGIAASYELVIRGNWSGASLKELIEKQLAPFAETGRLSLRGPQLLLSPEAAQSIGMALHELATNATKYGALSVPEGSIDITWRLVTCSIDQRVIIRWTEKGGPTVMPPTRKGFGNVVIDRMITNGIQGKVAVDFRPSGLVWSVDFPAVHLVQHGNPLVDGAVAAASDA